MLSAFSYCDTPLGVSAFRPRSHPSTRNPSHTLGSSNVHPLRLRISSSPTLPQDRATARHLLARASSLGPPLLALLLPRGLSPAASAVHHARRHPLLLPRLLDAIAATAAASDASCAVALALGGFVPFSEALIRHLLAAAPGAPVTACTAHSLLTATARLAERACGERRARAVFEGSCIPTGLLALLRSRLLAEQPALASPLLRAVQALVTHSPAGIRTFGTPNLAAALVAWGRVALAARRADTACNIATTIAWLCSDARNSTMFRGVGAGALVAPLLALARKVPTLGPSALGLLGALTYPPDNARALSTEPHLVSTLLDFLETMQQPQPVLQQRSSTQGATATTRPAGPDAAIAAASVRFRSDQVSLTNAASALHRLFVHGGDADWRRRLMRRGFVDRLVAFLPFDLPRLFRNAAAPLRACAVEILQNPLTAAEIASARNGSDLEHGLRELVRSCTAIIGDGVGAVGLQASAS